MKNITQKCGDPESGPEKKEILEAVQKLSAEISVLKSDLQYYVNKTDTGILNARCSGMENGAIEIFSGGCVDEVKEVMGIIAGDCPMSESCSAIFSQMLYDMILEYKKGTLDDERIECYRKKMIEMREKAPFESCKNCFDKNECIFEKSIKSCDEFRNLFSGKNPEKGEKSVQDINPGDIVSSYLEPLANRHRFRVMQELYYSPKSFSELSELTGLKGGNLLFHLEKLLGTGMILQKQDRGLYIISDTGTSALNRCTEFCQ